MQDKGVHCLKGLAKARGCNCNGRPGIMPYEKYASKIIGAQVFKNKLSLKFVQQYISVW